MDFIHCTESGVRGTIYLVVCHIHPSRESMSEQTFAPRVPIDELVRELRACPTSAFDTTEEIVSLLRRMPVEEASLAPYLCWDRQHYTRNLIDKTDLYELVAVCWEVGQSSSVHNHRDQNCWMSAPIGRLKVQNFRVTDQDAALGTCHILPTDIYEMDAAHPVHVDPLEPVHQVLNLPEFNQRAVSIHVYSKPFDTCEVYQREKGTYRDVPLHHTSEYGKLNPEEKLI